MVQPCKLGKELRKRQRLWVTINNKEELAAPHIPEFVVIIYFLVIVGHKAVHNNGKQFFLLLVVPVASGCVTM
jgi:hypothetical protein